jgi:hypothetical protein
MENLLIIEALPIEVKFVEKEPIKLPMTDAAQVSVSQNDGQQDIRPQPIKISLKDTFEPSSNYNWEQSTYTATAKVGEDGSLKLNIQMEDGEARAIRFKQSVRGIDSMAGMASVAAMMPVNPVASSDVNNASNMEISFNMSSLSSSLSSANKLNTQFYPPDLELEVTQMPKVIIKYVGGPIYVPPSSDPNYKPLIGFESAADTTVGMSAFVKLDQKA